MISMQMLTNYNAKTLMQCTLNDWGILKITGIDKVKFLQGQLTCDVSRITPDRASFGAYLNVKGRVISTLILTEWQGSFYLLLPLALTDAVHGLLKKYALFAKITIEDVSKKLSLTALMHYSSTNSAWQTTADETQLLITLPNQNAILLKDKSTDPSVSEELWQLALINMPLPWLSAQTTEVFTAHDLNLPALNAVSFDKGCYKGQEIVARMQYRGKLKHKMVHMRFEKPCDEKSFVDENQNEVAKVVNIVQLPEASEGLLWGRDEVIDKKMVTGKNGQILRFTVY